MSVRSFALRMLALLLVGASIWLLLAGYAMLAVIVALGGLASYLAAVTAP